MQWPAGIVAHGPSSLSLCPARREAMASREGGGRNRAVKTAGEDILPSSPQPHFGMPPRAQAPGSSTIAPPATTTTTRPLLWVPGRRYRRGDWMGRTAWFDGTQQPLQGGDLLRTVHGALGLLQEFGAGSCRGRAAQPHGGWHHAASTVHCRALPPVHARYCPQQPLIATLIGFGTAGWLLLVQMAVCC
jgi:hypothetical protein